MGSHRILQESPRWLMVKGKVEEAKKVLCYAAEVNKKTIPFNLLNEVRGFGPGMRPGLETMETSSIIHSVGP